MSAQRLLDADAGAVELTGRAPERTPTQEQMDPPATTARSRARVPEPRLDDVSQVCASLSDCEPGCVILCCLCVCIGFLCEVGARFVGNNCCASSNTSNTATTALNPHALATATADTTPTGQPKEKPKEQLTSDVPEATV
jgi:hypothetical protein